MSRIGSGLTAIALATFLAAGAAVAQTPATPPTPKPAPAASASSQASTAAQVETWTRKQWAAAKKEWAKDKTKWADCRKQSKGEKLKGRKSWSFLYTCMSN